MPRALTPSEKRIIEHVAKTFVSKLVRAGVHNVMKSDGRMVETLCIAIGRLDEAIHVERNQIALSAYPEDVAEEIERDFAGLETRPFHAPLS